MAEQVANSDPLLTSNWDAIYNEYLESELGLDVLLQEAAAFLPADGAGSHTKYTEQVCCELQPQLGCQQQNAIGTQRQQGARRLTQSLVPNTTATERLQPPTGWQRWSDELQQTSKARQRESVEFPTCSHDYVGPTLGHAPGHTRLTASWVPPACTSPPASYAALHTQRQSSPSRGAPQLFEMLYQGTSPHRLRPNPAIISPGRPVARPARPTPCTPPKTRDTVGYQPPQAASQQRPRLPGPSFGPPPRKAWAAKRSSILPSADGRSQSLASSQQCSDGWSQLSNSVHSSLGSASTPWMPYMAGTSASRARSVSPGARRPSGTGRSRDPSSPQPGRSGRTSAAGSAAPVEGNASRAADMATQADTAKLRRAALDVGLIQPASEADAAPPPGLAPSAGLRPRSQQELDLFMSPQAYRDIACRQQQRQQAAGQHPTKVSVMRNSAAASREPPTEGGGSGRAVMPGANRALRDLQELAELESQITAMMLDQQQQLDPAAAAGRRMQQASASAHKPVSMWMHPQAAAAVGSRSVHHSPAVLLKEFGVDPNGVDGDVPGRTARKQLDFGVLAPPKQQAPSAQRAMLHLSSSWAGSAAPAAPAPFTRPAAAPATASQRGISGGGGLDIQAMVQHLTSLETSSLEVLRGYASGYIDGRIAANPRLHGVRSDVVKDVVLKLVEEALRRKQATGSVLASTGLAVPAATAEPDTEEPNADVLPAAANDALSVVPTKPVVCRVQPLPSSTAAALPAPLSEHTYETDPARAASQPAAEKPADRGQQVAQVRPPTWSLAKPLPQDQQTYPGVRYASISPSRLRAIDKEGAPAKMEENKHDAPVQPASCSTEPSLEAQAAPPHQEQAAEPSTTHQASSLEDDASSEQLLQISGDSTSGQLLAGMEQSSVPEPAAPGREYVETLTLAAAPAQGTDVPVEPSQETEAEDVANGAEDMVHAALEHQAVCPAAAPIIGSPAPDSSTVQAPHTYVAADSVATPAEGSWPGSELCERASVLSAVMHATAAHDEPESARQPDQAAAAVDHDALPQGQLSATKAEADDVTKKQQQTPSNSCAAAKGKGVAWGLEPILAEIRAVKASITPGNVQEEQLTRMDRLLEQLDALREELVAKHGPGHKMAMQLRVLQGDLAKWRRSVSTVPAPSQVGVQVGPTELGGPSPTEGASAISEPTLLGQAADSVAACMSKAAPVMACSEVQGATSSSADASHKKGDSEVPTPQPAEESAPAAAATSVTVTVEENHAHPTSPPVPRKATAISTSSVEEMPSPDNRSPTQAVTSQPNTSHAPRRQSTSSVATEATLGDLAGVGSPSNVQGQQPLQVTSPRQAGLANSFHFSQAPAPLASSPIRTTVDVAAPVVDIPPATLAPGMAGSLGVAAPAPYMVTSTSQQQLATAVPLAVVPAAAPGVASSGSSLLNVANQMNQRTLMTQQAAAAILSNIMLGGGRPQLGSAAPVHSPMAVPLAMPPVGVYNVPVGPVGLASPSHASAAQTAANPITVHQQAPPAALSSNNSPAMAEQDMHRSTASPAPAKPLVVDSFEKKHSLRGVLGGLFGKK